MNVISSIRQLGFAFVVILSQLAASLAQAETWFVDPVNGDDGNSGTGGWGNAKESIQGVLDDEDLVPESDDVWVAAGTYTPSVQLNLGSGTAARKVTFAIPEGLTLLGGFEGDESSASEADPTDNPTILSGDLGGGSFAYHVVTIIGTDSEVLEATLIEGFTITKGLANENSGANSVGGGAFIYDGEEQLEFGPVFKRCTFADNESTNAGGAILCQKTGVQVRNCVFTDNTTDGTGEGFNLGGGAISALGKIRGVNSIFHTNSCTDGDGGAINNDAHDTTLFNCDLRDNSSTGSGGAVYSGGTYVNCVFAGNTATGTGSDGGGLAPAGVLQSCTFVHNDADDDGGGALSPSTVENCIFWKNTDGGSGGHGAQFTGTACPENSIVEDFTSFGGCSGTTVSVRDSHLLNDGDWQVSEACDEEVLSGGDESITNHLEGTEIGDLLDELM